MRLGSRHWLILQPLITVGIVFFLMQLSPYKLLELSYEDLLLTQSNTLESSSDDIVVLLITDDTLAKLPYRSPIDRAYLATIFDKLSRTEAKAIGVDILFDQSTEPAKDAKLRAVFDRIADRLIVATASRSDGLSDKQIAFQNQFLDGLTKASVLLAKNSVDGVVRHTYTGRVHDDVTNHNLARAMTSDSSGIAPNLLDRIFYQSNNHALPYKYKVYPAESASFLPNEWFDGKYVLIGMGVPGIDQFRTPFASRLGEVAGTMPGVMIHANIVNQHLSRVRVADASKSLINIAVVAAAVFGTMLMLMEAPIIVRLLPVLLVFIATLVVPFWVFSDSHMLVPAIPIATSLLISVLIGALVRWREDRRQRAFTKSAWSRYLSPGIVDELLTHPEKLQAGGERRDISVIFTDIAHFTRLVEGMPIELLTPLLNRYLDRVSSEFLDAGATIDKIMGDGVMGFFGAPLNEIDHADKAVALALRLDQVCREFQREMMLEGIAIGRTRIGIHTGEAIVGNFGGTRFFDYTAHGNTVNTAARLESANKLLGSGICVSGDTARRAKRHSFRPIGQLLLAGKNNLIDAWEPLHEDMSNLVPLEEYKVAYRQLEQGSVDSLQVFTKLSINYPDDHLISFHVERLNNNHRGIQFETSK